MDVYNLINSKAISNYCREIKHQFNTEELAVLIYRNNKMNIDEKILAYKELIEKYPDMEVIERINCEHYFSVKDMIKNEILRLDKLSKKLKQDEEDVVYTYIPFYESTQEYYPYTSDLDNIYKTYRETYTAVNEEIEEYNDIEKFRMIKRHISSQENKVIAEFMVENKIPKMINLYDPNDNFLDIDNIFVNIPTPFKKGDILVEGKESNNREVFVLDWLCNWDERLPERLLKGNCDSSDMNGTGYYIYNGMPISDHHFNYDNWEYYDDELKGMNKILVGISNLLKEKIDISLFLNSYEEIKKEQIKTNLNWFTDEGLKLAGFTQNEIKRIKE